MFLMAPLVPIATLMPLLGIIGPMAPVEPPMAPLEPIARIWCSTRWSSTWWNDWFHFNGTSYNMYSNWFHWNHLGFRTDGGNRWNHWRVGVWNFLKSHINSIMESLWIPTEPLLEPFIFSRYLTPTVFIINALSSLCRFDMSSHQLYQLLTSKEHSIIFIKLSLLCYLIEYCY